MKIHLRRTVGILATLLFVLIYTNDFAQTLNDSLLLGAWQGDVVTLMGDNHVVLRFNRNDAKELVATFESPDLSDKKYDADVELIGDSISLEISGRHGTAKYDAIYDKDSAALIGQYTQYGFKISLKMIKGETSDRLYKRPQTPVEPYPYKQEEVTIENKKDHITLAGTFTRPENGSKFPAVILVTGSGPQDRNERLFGHKPFLVLSDFLTRKGYAVLRCDDRGTAKSGGDFDAATTTDFATDAEAQLEYLKGRADVDVNKIGIIGHSEGGMVAVMLAARRQDVAFIVMMAGPAMNSFDLMVMQDSLVALSTGYTEKNVRPYLELQRKLFSIALNTEDSSRASDQVDSLLTKEKVSDMKIEAAMKQLLSPWFRSFIKFNPEEYLKNVHCPVLAIDGEKDIQVPAAANIAALKKTFKSVGKKNYKAVELPGLNHLFQQCISCKLSEYKKIQETINPVALNTIGDWMDEHVKKGEK